MKLNLIPLAFCSACLVLAVQSFLSTRAYSAGELDPPEAPGPSMVSLAELSAQVANIQARVDAQLPGGNVLALSQATGEVFVWDENSADWNKRPSGGTVSSLKISNDNVLVVASNGAIYVWNDTTKEWSRNESISGTVTQSAGSNGNFFLRTSANTVVAWNKENSQFSTEAISGTIVGQTGSEGSYLYITGSNRAAIWTPQLGAWKLTSFSSGLTAYGTDE